MAKLVRPAAKLVAARAEPALRSSAAAGARVRVGVDRVQAKVAPAAGAGEGDGLLSYDALEVRDRGWQCTLLRSGTPHGDG